MREKPTDEIFEEMKKEAAKVWETYDNTFGYVDEKLERINSVTNIEDNAMVFFRMFDHVNQSKMTANLSEEAVTYIKNNQ